METIVVESNHKGKYGPSVKVNGEFVNFSKFYKGVTELPIGIPVQADIFVTDAGKKYINRVELDKVEGGPVTTKTLSKTVKSYAKKEVKEVDWAAKDRSQLVGGRSHDAATLVNASLLTNTPVADVIRMHREVLEALLKMAEEVK